MKRALSLLPHLPRMRLYCSGFRSFSSNLATSICKQIKYSGPISVAQYMKEVLTTPHAGYYVHKDMLGRQGDFITSPELNQMFGELIAIWFINEWSALGSPKSFRFVELGPGRGSLADDILKQFKHFEQIFKDVDMSFHFVEISKRLSNIQYETLCDGNLMDYLDEDNSEYYLQGSAKRNNVPLHWHRHIENVPRDKFTFYLAHEFFDALPVHKFVKSSKGWRELYVDVTPESNDELSLVQLQEETVASKTLIRNHETRSHVEVCPEGRTIISSIAKQIEKNGGAGLIIDYGHTGEKEDTLRSFKDHKLNDIFDNIGDADLTADVDFRFLLDNIESIDIQKSGPITQKEFLTNMGIELRLMILLQHCKDSAEKKKLTDSYKIMMDEKEMGERFKVLALSSKTRQTDSPITGFFSLTQNS
uniref:protein arginine methyltransferase NDUFAF7, mitochondrial-like n=1 Tax=Styela clava TaxID=7725 RepID=UPI00193A1D31|nr:protein arginine methyltransferase NDUFAF7, mitochondrial-like [Styela clava]